MAIVGFFSFQHVINFAGIKDNKRNLSKSVKFGLTLNKAEHSEAEMRKHRVK